MIDPDNVTQYNATKAWKEEFLLFCACVAGKSAFQQARKLDDFLNYLDGARRFSESSEEMEVPMTPFELINLFGDEFIMDMLKAVKLGQYNRLLKVFRNVATFDADTVTLEQLEAVPGIGPKTARFFLTHTRPNQNFAILDTHILGYLRDLQSQGVESLAHLGYTIPKSTPSGSKYKDIEQAVLQLVTDSGMTTADWDLQVWKSRRKRSYK